jgi:hypothetical protein
VHVGDDEVLLDDSVGFVERTIAARVDARLVGAGAVRKRKSGSKDLRGAGPVAPSFAPLDAKIRSSESSFGGNNV